MLNKKIYWILNLIFILLIIVPFVSSFAVEDPGTVHQYIANESKEIWKLAPYELKEHITNPLDTNINDYNYQWGDDVIDGSGEEDTPSLSYLSAFAHFWEPDEPKDGDYDKGLQEGFPWSSSYQKAEYLWNTYVIPYYVKGQKDVSYYYLGRVVHLLEDASVPEHMHLDRHPDTTCTDQQFPIPGGDSALECNTKDLSVFSQFDGADYIGKEYNYSNPIPSLSRADWEAINPKIREASYPTELFKLFWYTAQKTQYYASDDSDGNQFYKEADLTSKNLPDLWLNDGVTMVNKSAELTADEINYYFEIFMEGYKDEDN